jgi:hypothetical protein
MKIKHILLSCDDSYKYISFWPTVAYHWKSLGYKVHLGLLTTRTEDVEYINNIKKYGDSVFIFMPSKKYNLMIQSKLLRFYISKYFLDEISCISDIDFYTLDDHKHAEDLVTDEIINNDKIATLGYNAYINYDNLNIEDIKKQGVYRVPACPFISKGKNIYSIFHDDINSDFNEFLDTLCVNLNNTITLKEEKSDENILYYLMTQNIAWSKNNIIFNIRNDFKNFYGQWCMWAFQRIDRGNQCKYHKDKLHSGYYIDLCPSRPYNKDEIEYLLDYLKIPKELQNIKL